MKNQPSTRSDGSFITSKQSPKKGPTISSGYSSDAKPTLTSLATPLSPSHVTPNTTSDHASSFPYTQADGRKSPPRPVLRAVDWSNPVRSSSLSSDEDGEEIDEEEEFDELADDTSEADSRVPEIVDGWNSHMADEETEKVVHSSLNDPSGSMRQVSPFSPYQPNKDEGKELAPDEVILTLPSEPDSLEPQAPPSSDSFKAAETKANIPSDQKKDDESVVSVTLDHDMDVDLPSGTPSAIPPPTLSAPDAGFPPQPPSQSPSVYPSYYASPPPSADLPHQAPIHGVSHSSQPPSMHPHHHASHMPNVPLSPYPPSQLHQNVNPYPPPTHTYGYHHPQPPPPHMAAYPPHHSTYTTPSWYSNSYFPPHNHQVRPTLSCNSLNSFRFYSQFHPKLRTLRIILYLHIRHPSNRMSLYPLLRIIIQFTCHPPIIFLIHSLTVLRITLCPCLRSHPRHFIPRKIPKFHILCSRLKANTLRKIFTARFLCRCL